MFSKFKIVVNNNVGEKLIEEIYNLDKKVFKNDYLWTSDYRIELYNKNKKSFIMITYKKKLIGYINYLCISHEKYDKIISSWNIINEFDPDDIVSFEKGKNNYVSINSVVIDPIFQDGEVIVKLTNRFLKELTKLNKKGFHIAGLVGVSTSDDGAKFLNRIGLTHYKTLDEDTNIYILEETK